MSRVLLIVELTDLCQDSGVTRRIPLAFPIVVGGIGLILVISSAAQLRQSEATKQWSSTPGKILRSQIRPIEQLREKKQKVILYAAEVAYSYTIDGKEHVSDTIRKDLQSQSDTIQAERLIELYPVGRIVTVYYNPANPSDAVLEPGRNPQTSSLLACGIALVIVCGIMLVIRFLRLE